jgi:2-dehydro-3-deoxygalactonokinase
MNAHDTTRLIALDWGTSNLRASRLGDGGQVLETRAAAGGVMAVPERRFEAALRALCGDWLDAAPRRPVIASGMVGSRQGWQEAPYVACPAGLAQAAAQLTRIDLAGGAALHIVPGLRCVGRDGQHDVMRGEETQLWGADLAPGSVAVLPGTHAKWAWLGEGSGGQGEITSFQTYMTGELYGLATAHGILGRLMRFDGGPQPAAFERGARLGLAEHANATHVLFAARTAGLMGEVAPEALPDFLSGLLIGIEIGSATRAATPRAVTLVGDDALCARYAAALACAGIDAPNAPPEATTRGQWRVAEAAGLLEGGR